MVSWGHADLDLVRDFHEGSHETTLVSFVNLHPLQNIIICCTSGAFVKLCTLFTDHVDGCDGAVERGIGRRVPNSMGSGKHLSWGIPFSWEAV